MRVRTWELSAIDTASYGPMVFKRFGAFLRPVYVNAHLQGTMRYNVLSSLRKCFNRTEPWPTFYIRGPVKSLSCGTKVIITGRVTSKYADSVSQFKAFNVSQFSLSFSLRPIDP